MSNYWFDGWDALLRTLVVGVASYLALLVVLRTTGKRTLAKLNAFDLIVTVALGSTLASVLTSKDVTFAQGALAFLLLAGLQYAVTWLSLRSPAVRRMVRSEPALLVHDGELLHGALRRERVTRDELDQVIRNHGVARVEDAHTVILETDGSFSVVARGAPSAPSPGQGTLPERRNAQ